jgi:hypothetical protein
MDKEVLIIVTIVAAVGLLGIVVVEADTVVKRIQAFAAGPGFPGCANTPGFNRSFGRCFHTR